MPIVLRLKNPGIARRSWALDQIGLALTRGRILGKLFNLSHFQSFAKIRLRMLISQVRKIKYGKHVKSI